MSAQRGLGAMADGGWTRRARDGLRATVNDLAERFGHAGDAAPVFRPPVVMPGDPARGEAMLAGRIVFAGQTVDAQGAFPWDAAEADPGWRDAAHGFAWLGDLAALGTATARAAALGATLAWIDRHDQRRDPVWRADLLGRRVLAWLGQIDWLLDGADADIRATLLASLDRQARTLARMAPFNDMPDGFAAVAGLVVATLALPVLARRRDRALALLEDEIARQVLADGGHVGRSPSRHLEALRDLAGLRATLGTAGVPVPASLTEAIARMAPMLRFFRHGDGALALFNGVSAETPAAIDVVLGLAAAPGSPPASALASGFERLAAGRTLAIVDVGPPQALATAATHAGMLSLEFGVGRERLIVNCGAHAGRRPDWEVAMRAPAAHSTAAVDDADPLAGTIACGVARHRDDAGQWLEAAHDGYHAGTGFRLRRRLYLDADGTDFRGEDSFEGKGEGRFTVRFHLHPKVRASLVGDGAGVLLRLAESGGWRLRAAGAALAIEDSVYLGSGQPQRTEQIVLRGPLKPGKTTVKWALARVRR